MKLPKRPLGARVSAETLAALKRQAAADNISVNKLCDRIFRNHIDLRQQGHSSTDLAGFVMELEGKLDEMEARGKQQMEWLVGRLERNILSLKAMIDSHVETALGPSGYQGYVRTVEKMLEAMRAKGLMNGGHRN